MFLICTDLDGTLLPDGSATESPGARDRFRRLAARDDVRVAYVTGRSLGLVKSALAEWAIPTPDFVIADVGTTIWASRSGEWSPVREWAGVLAGSWHGDARERLRNEFSRIPELEEQEPARQSGFKLSYYSASAIDPESLAARMRDAARDVGIGATVIGSVDARDGRGLLDALAPPASKETAIDHLRGAIGVPRDLTVFGGDSGNDLEVLASPIPAVLVANATEAVRTECRRRAARNGTEGALYLARGGFLGMNGNFAAGLLEGCAHFIPGLAAWIEGEE